jgi:putative tricarboxylic transport membrane protein
VFDVFVMIGFGVLGYLMRKFGYEPAPLVLAFVLGPLLENNLRKSLILSQGVLRSSSSGRSRSPAWWLVAIFLLIAPLLPALRKKREKVALDVTE